ncbi:MAG: hypothetical protein WCC06_00780 [Candidatus Aminicenantales bacterium]
MAGPGFRNFGSGKWKTTMMDYPHSGIKTPDWARISVYRDGRLIGQFPGGTEIRRIPRPYRPPERTWKPKPPTQRELDIANRIAQRRAMDEAGRQAEKARERERAARDARIRGTEAERARLSDKQTRERIERARQQQISQQKRIREEVLRTFKEMQARIQRQNFEMQRRNRESQRSGTWLGTALADMVPPGIRRYAMRRPLEDTFFGLQGKKLIFAQAERTARQIQFAMNDFNFWVTQVANIASAVIGASGEYMATVGMTQALQSLKKPIASFINREVASSAVRLSGQAGGAKSTDQVLMGCRDEAHRIAQKLFQQDLARGSRTSPQEFGNIVDAIFKSLVQQARRDGLVPRTIRTAPPPLSISGTHLPRGGAVDVWDSATGVGWDVTKATGRNVAEHDVRYLLGRAKRDGTIVPPRNTMPDGTRLRDVRPLVYPR